MLIKLSCYSKTNSAFYDLVKFWLSFKNEYPALHIKSIRILIPYEASRLNEAGFSVVAVWKSKYQSKMNVEPETRMSVSSHDIFVPIFLNWNFEYICFNFCTCLDSLLYLLTR